MAINLDPRGIDLNDPNVSQEQRDYKNWYLNLPPEQKVFHDIERNSNQILEQAAIDAGAAIEAAIATGRTDIIASVRSGVKAAMASTAEGVRAAQAAAGRGFDEIERYFQEGVKFLQPFIDQGIFASDEVASMLAIPNSKGEVVPFDLEQLEQTPGYQFEFGQGIEAISRAYQGNFQGGSAMKDITRFGQGLAEGYFSRRIDQLMGLATLGEQSARGAATIASAAGGQAGQLAGTLTSTLGGLYQNEASTVGSLFGQQAQSLGSLAGATAGLQAGLIQDIANSRLNIDLALQNARLQDHYRKWEQENSGSFLGDLVKTGISGIVGGIAGGIAGPIGGAIGTRVTNAVLGGNKTKGFETRYGLDLGLGSGYGRV